MVQFQRFLERVRNQSLVLQRVHFREVRKQPYGQLQVNCPNRIMNREELSELVGFAGTFPLDLPFLSVNRRGLKAKPGVGTRGDAGCGTTRPRGSGLGPWPGPAPGYAISRRRAAPPRVTPPRPRGGGCPVTASDGRGSCPWFVNWQLKLPTQLWS